MDSRVWTQLIVAELMLRRLWEIYAIPQIASFRDMWMFYVRAAGLILHWFYGWMYHVRLAAHHDSNEVWDDIIGSQGTSQYFARHSSGWSGPAHAATS